MATSLRHVVEPGTCRQSTTIGRRAGGAGDDSQSETAVTGRGYRDGM